MTWPESSFTITAADSKGLSSPPLTVYVMSQVEDTGDPILGLYAAGDGYFEYYQSLSELIPDIKPDTIPVVNTNALGKGLDAAEDFSFSSGYFELPWSI